MDRAAPFAKSDMTDRGSQHFASLVSDAEYDVVAKKIVDATYMNVTVPSKRRPLYEVAEGANCVPPNALPRLTGKWDRYTVVGAGKTGMDACLFLLKNDVEPDQIAWIMPRDPWLYNRADIKLGEMFAQPILCATILKPSSIRDLLLISLHVSRPMTISCALMRPYGPRCGAALLLRKPNLSS
jgi:hypothetical protein